MLPSYRYHPDPLATGSVVQSSRQCLCCGQARGYIYIAPVYARGRLQKRLCPWCIADGSAAAKFDAAFSDAHQLMEAGVPADVVEEVTRRTPGYFSFQQAVWLACCGDACEFHGDAPRAELQALGGDALTEALSEIGWSSELWAATIENYQPGEDPAVYKFVCRYCGRARYWSDCS